MGEKPQPLTFGKFCRRGGASKSRVKMEAVARNLAKAQQALSARRAARTESVVKSENCGRPA
jgi:hypothetical protein